MKQVAAALLAAAATLAGPANAQIYADFQTSKGNFTCELYYTTAPRTVANFIGLATGTKAWLDEQTGIVSTTKPPRPFYNGLTFHRVVNQTDFAIAQAGSRTADGSDGPGYSFPDEAKESVPLSYKFDQPYLLAMANAGPNTNGSQFFVTGTTIPHLEGLHTVFGKVTEGTSVVDAILDAEVDSNDKPVTAITIQNVAIRVVDKEAKKFKPLKQPLPTIVAPRFKTAALPGGQSHRLLYKQPPGSMTRIWTLTPANEGWTLVFQRYIGLGDTTIGGADVPLGGKVSPTIAPTTWLRPVNTLYSSDALAPTQIVKWHIELSNEAGDFVFDFPSSGDHTYSYTATDSTTPQTGTVVNSYYFPDGYGTTLILELSDLEPLRFRMAFDSLTGNTYTGRQNGSYWNGAGWVSIADGSNYTMTAVP